MKMDSYHWKVFIVKITKCCKSIYTIFDDLFSTHFIFSIISNRICVDSLKRYHLLSNVNARKSLLGVRDVNEDSKIGTFRLRPKQLEKLGVAVCEINYRRYRALWLGNKAKYLKESIGKYAQKTDQALD